jgi:hypothetical protein
LRFFIEAVPFNLHSIALQHLQMEPTYHVPCSDHRKQCPPTGFFFPSTDPGSSSANGKRRIQLILTTVAMWRVNPVPHLDANLLGGWMKPEEQRNAAEQASLQRSNELTDELLAADVLVMAAPMYNFAIPSTLKAWLDHVLRAGVTFKYTDTGPQGC